MTATGRAIVAVVALACGVLLIALGVILHDASAQTSGVGMAGPVLGYVFGDRNGEKRLASAMTVLQADAVTKAGVVAPEAVAPALVAAAAAAAPTPRKRAPARKSASKRATS